MTKTYTNRKLSAEVVMDGECLGYHREGKTCVRPTKCGKFAVIATVGTRLVAVCETALHARRLNFSIHGDSLGI